MMLWNMAEAVDGIPNLGVGQGKKNDVVSQRLNENEFALPLPPKKSGHAGFFCCVCFKRPSFG